jgi:3-oxoacyl-[acyl-carrier-protein] synthase III
MRPGDLHLRAVGCYLPPTRVSAEQAIAEGLYSRAEYLDGGVTGAYVATHESVAEMAVRAARRALDRCGPDPAGVSVALHASLHWQGPVGWSPVGYVLRELGCPAIPGYEVHQGCNGVLAAMELSAGLLACARPGATSLITTAASAYSSGLSRWSSGGPTVVMSDGAAAVLLGPGSGFARLEAVNSVMAAEIEGMYRGDEALGEPDTRPAVDVLARIRAYSLRSRRPVADVYSHMTKAFSGVLHTSLDEAGIGAADLARVMFSHVAPHFLETAILAPLGLPASRSTWTFGRTVGHLGGADQIAALEHELRTGQLHPGDRVLLASGAPGYNVSCAVLTITGVPAWAGDTDQGKG